MKNQSKKEMIREYKLKPAVGGVYVIKNTQNGKFLLQSTGEIVGSKNRFDFCQLTDTCAYTSLQKDWREYGAKSFCFEVLEQLTQKETQTQQEFKADIKILEDIWKEKLSEHDLY